MNKKSTNKSNIKHTIYNENIQYIKKENKLRIVAEEMPDYFPFSISFSIISGSRDEVNVPNGTAHFLEHILFRRTKRLKSKQIAKEFEKYGAIANAFTTKEYTSYFVTANYKNLSKVLRLLYEVVFHPEFNEQDIEKERKIIIDEIISSEEDPEDVLNDKIAEIQYPKNKISKPIAGSIESVSLIQKRDLEVFFDNHYVAENIVVSYAGPNLNLFLNEIEKYDFRTAKRLKTKTKLILNEPNIGDYFSNITSQTHLTMSYLKQSNDINLRIAIALFNIMLSEAMSSRLYQALRERNGLTYNVYSGLTNYIDFTELYVYTSFDSKYKNKVFKLIEREFEKIRQKSFSKNEFKIAKELLKTYSLLENEGSLNKINNLTRQVMLYDNIEDSSEIIESIDNFKYEDVANYTQEIFDISKWYKCYLNPD